MDPKKLPYTKFDKYSSIFENLVHHIGSVISDLWNVISNSWSITEIPPHYQIWLESDSCIENCRLDLTIVATNRQLSSRGDNSICLEKKNFFVASLCLVFFFRCYSRINFFLIRWMTFWYGFRHGIFPRDDHKNFLMIGLF